MNFDQQDKMLFFSLNVVRQFSNQFKNPNSCFRWNRYDSKMFWKTSEKTVEKLKKTLFVSEKIEKKTEKTFAFSVLDSFFACF